MEKGTLSNLPFDSSFIPEPCEELKGDFVSPGRGWRGEAKSNQMDEIASSAAGLWGR